MKITYDVRGEIIKERVVGEFVSYYITESGAQVRKEAVIKFDRRGGSKKGSGRKEGGRKVVVPLYTSPESKAVLLAEAKSKGVTISILINQKLGL